ncbi:MAG: YdgA family protein [Thermodesulfobacteriota bacterium]
MRAILVIILVLLIAVVLAPFWFGQKAEDEYNKLLDTVSEVQGLEITSRSYNKGWLKSSAQVSYQVEYGSDESIKVLADDTIYHGPIPIGLIGKGKLMLKPVMAVIESKAELKTDSTQEYAEIINALPPLSAETTIDLNGSGTYESKFDSIDITTKDNRTIKWSGLDGLGSFTLNPKKASSVFNSSEFMIEDDNAIVTIKDINMESDLLYPTSDLKNPLGNININFGELSSEGKNDEGPNKVVLNNFEINASTDQEAQLLNHSHSVSFDELIVTDTSYGPGDYEMEIRNIDKKAMEVLQDALAENYSDIDNSDQSNQLFLAQVMTVLPDLLKNSPEIEITKLSITTNEGEISGHAIISADGNSLDNPELAANPIFLLAAVSAEADLSVTKALFDNLLKDYKIEEIIDELNQSDEEIPGAKELEILANDRAQSEIAELLEADVLVLENGKYRIQASYRVGQVNLNGNILDLGSLMNQF